MSNDNSKTNTNFRQFTLGESHDLISIKTMAENRDAALAITQQAKQSIILFSYDLDFPTYNNSEFTNAVKNIVINNRHSSVKILIRNSQKIVNNGHQLLELARRLSSFIEIRKLPTEPETTAKAFLITDETALLYRAIDDQYEGHVNFNARLECRELINFFNLKWEISNPDPELQQLHI